MGDEYLIAEVPFSGGVDGSMRALASKKDFAVIADLMMGNDGTAAYSDDCKDAASEFFSQISGAFSTDLGAKISSSVSAAAPAILDSTGSDIFERDYVAFCTITIDGAEPITMLISPDETLLETLSPHFGGKKAESSADDSFAAPSSDTDIPLSQHSESAPGGSSFSAKVPKVNVDMLLDIELEVAIELGKANVAIKNVLDFAPGALIELDRFAGEPVDLLVNNKVVAKGEVVVIDENFGVRIISLVSPEERIRSLR
jgi:flagellar motor switch protein FliN/FliY